jgi:UDP-N-acetyl-2-amino-2-deoxyglucuronate dehydrogenase
MKAIRETGNNLVAALDKFDQVGVLDSWFPGADFFTEFERFDRHIDKLRRQGTKIDFVSICTPNYLHDSHIRFALRHQADAICEKPLVLNPWNAEALSEIERETGRKIYTILQLRLHPAIKALREKIKGTSSAVKHEVDLAYITSRGSWYQVSWKGDAAKSGGVATNIGIHFFDMLIWIFGPVRKNVVHDITSDYAAGYLELENARVRWFLSINFNHMPSDAKEKGKRTYRSLTLGNEEIEFSEGFGDLHTASYTEILSGRGFGVSDAAPSVQLVHDIRTAMIDPSAPDSHPMLMKVLQNKQRSVSPK